MTAGVWRPVAAGALIVLALSVHPRPALADSIRDRAWHLRALNIAEAHKVSQGAGVIVAVIDTGVDDKHAELAGAVLPGKAYGEGNATDGRVDRVGHGTAMAGVIAGRGLPNDGGVLGIAPKAMILPLRVANQESGLAPPQFLADAIDWAVGHDAGVICIASSTDRDDLVRQAVERALAAGVVVVAAAGNMPERSAIAYPAGLPGVVAVGGTDRTGAHARVSVSGPEMTVAAPAEDIVSTAPGGKYELGTGTSDATAIVSGVAALIRARYPNLSGPEVVHRITATATDKGKPGRDDDFGFGIVDPVAALTADVPPSDAASPAGGSAAPEAGFGGNAASAVQWATGLAVVVVIVVAGGLLLRRRTRMRR
ncbi:type VII secretion-associated serine protease mycosin [Dactylosporangium sp. CS-047395]|uniref:type VII secretion-associated serine protease mycosin n=1 Tax=Dactylosporangium sp. CS-047395 TaxID=3239936 RepID=UPI003D93E9D5